MGEMEKQEEMLTCINNGRMIEEAQKAMEQGVIIPYFQPKYDYAAKQWCGAEALIRWIHPEFGFLPLDFFIPVCEKSGQMPSLDLYILERVCMYQHRWKNLKLPAWQVSVNFSQIDFAEPGFVDQVLSILKRYQITERDIRFEITETACARCKNYITEFIRRVHEEKFCVDMDDFGSGYSTFHMLDEIRVDAVKLDANMIRKAGADRRSNKILRAVTRLAHELDMEIIAEGIETKMQADYLFEIGCRFMQGYYFSKPLSPDAYQQLMFNKDALADQDGGKQKEFEDDCAFPDGIQQAYAKYKKYDRKKRPNNKTGYTGVSITPEGKYRADITFKGKRYFLGKFDSIEEAASTRKQAEKLDDAFFEHYYESHPKAQSHTP